MNLNATFYMIKSDKKFIHYALHKVGKMGMILKILAENTKCQALGW